jgi:putative hemolysin
MSMTQVGLYVAGGALLFFLFFVIIMTGLEFAYFGANRLTVELKRKQQNKSARLLGDFFAQPERFWSATNISFYICLVGFCIALYALTGRLITLFPEAIRDFEYTELIIAWLLASAIIVSSITYFAKRGFEAHPEGSLAFWAPLINFISGITNPIANFFVRFSEIILLYLFNIKVPKKQAIFERVDANLFLRNTIHGQNDDDQLNKELFEKVIQLSQVKVRKCLIPRNEVLALDINATPQQVRDEFVKSKQSKIIIYEDNIDRVLGYVHHIELGKHPKTIREIMHSIPTVPEAMNAIDVIHLFTKERKSIAWVVDEFGGTAGVVTMEDVLEEIFGDIRDEYDIQEYTESQIAENEFIFSGRLKLDYIRNKYSIQIDADISETLSGYIIRQYTTIPKQNTKIIINKVEFDVLLATPTKVETVKLKVLHS